nr:MAG TPA: hypothetical protein [Caudoviricetes sp.]
MIFIQNVFLELFFGFVALFAASVIMGIIIIPCIMLLHYYESYHTRLIRKGKNQIPSVVNRRACRIRLLEKIILHVHIDGIIILTTAFICCYVHPWVWE